MQSVTMKNSNGLHLLFIPHCQDRKSLVKSQLERLQPYISSLIDTKPSLEAARGKLNVAVLSDTQLEAARSKLNLVQLSDTQAAFSIDEADDSIASDLLSKIRNICNECLTERLIVSQNVSKGNAVRHRVMQFEVYKSQMFVSYATIGDFNNFDAAMQAIAKMYPDVCV